MMSNMSAMSDDTASVSSLSMEIESQSVNQIEDVLVISLGDDSECPGMLTEQKVIWDQICATVKLMAADNNNSLL